MLSGYGCNIGNHFMGVLGYADELAILYPSIQDLVCEQFAIEYHLIEKNQS